MGGSNNKLSVISYDDAIRRVTDAELRRLRDGFRRLSGINGTMSLATFVRDVLGDGTPAALAERFYSILGGSSKGLSFKELVCGLVVITRGKEEEKIKLIFSLFAEDSHSYIDKDDMLESVAEFEGRKQQQLDQVMDLFVQGNRVDYDSFRSWLLMNMSFLSISNWLLIKHARVTLTSDNQTPTFYQTLVGVTHLEESDLSELEKRYWSLKNISTSKFDIETFVQHVSPPIPATTASALFHAFDENRDGHIDFKELVCGISACCRGPTTERHKFCFKMFDADADGKINRDEVKTMLEAFTEVYRGEGGREEMSVEALMAELLADKDSLSQAEYLVWTMTHSLPQMFLQLLVQVCHVVMGLKPLTREEERKVVIGWLDRSHRAPQRVGDTFYLISMNWWQKWRAYIGTTDETAKTSQSSPGGSPGSRIVGLKPGFCPSLGRKYDVSPEEEDLGVVGVNYSTLPSNGVSSGASSSSGTLGQPSDSPRTTDSPKKFNTVPRPTNRNGTPSRSSKNSTPPPSPRTTSRPGQIDNSSLVLSTQTRVLSLTHEGGVLRKDRLLTRGVDFEIVPEAMWRALWGWYNSTLPLPRKVMLTSAGPELELFPLQVRLYRHTTGPRPAPTTTFTGMIGGLGGFVMGPNTAPRRYLAHTACFSRNQTIAEVLDMISGRLKMNREDLRLWKYPSEMNMKPLENEYLTVEEAKIEDGAHLLIEVRNKDQTWPEELHMLACNRGNLMDNQSAITAGVTGLSNLGNTCFMNSALQCVSHTVGLREYFREEMYKYELNRTNPLGMKGHVALRYAELINDLWSGKHRSIAPLKMRWTIAKYAPRFNGFQQHDCQELLAFLLDGLHEDLNRVQDKPYVELKDSDGRPDEEVAQEAWLNHLSRNKSVVVDLFHGQLKSCVLCCVCGHTSVRFDPFTCLSLPLPIEESIHLEIIVLWLSGAAPVRYGLELAAEDTYRVLKQKLSELSGLTQAEIMLAEVYGAAIKSYPRDCERVKVAVLCSLWAYQVLPPPPLPSMSPEEERNPSPPPPLVLGPPLDPGASGAGEGGGVEELLPPCNVIVAVHRKSLRMDSYLLSFQKTRPSLFGTPLIVPCHDDTTHNALYQNIWQQVTRLVSPVPASETHNHATYCDDSLACNYPFTLTLVTPDGLSCSTCPWFHFCRGCRLNCDDELFRHASTHIAIDWEPTALHLRYQQAQEKVSLEHSSVALSRKRQSEPIDLHRCLTSFTRPEDLDETWFCSKCKGHQRARKQLQLWRLPPVLIVHLKRFQLLHNRWVKSGKVVRFPFRDFDPSEFIVNRSREPAKEQSSEQNNMKTSDKEQNSVRTMRGDDVKMSNGVSAAKSSPMHSSNPTSPAPGARRAASPAPGARRASNEDVSRAAARATPGHGVGGLTPPGHAVANLTPACVDGCNDDLVPNGTLQGETGLGPKGQGHDLLDSGLASRHDLHRDLHQPVSPPTTSPTFSSNPVKSPSSPLQTQSRSTRSGVRSESSPDVKLATKYSGKWTSNGPLNGPVNGPVHELGPVDDLASRPHVSESSPEVATEAVEGDELSGTEDEDYTNVKYNLYALACHSGQLGCGHYVSYARNMDDKWYQFNDSMCKEVSEAQVDTSSAYILFYERSDVRVNWSRLLPDAKQLLMRQIDNLSIDDECDSEIKKMCRIM